MKEEKAYPLVIQRGNLVLDSVPKTEREVAQKSYDHAMALMGGVKIDCNPMSCDIGTFPLPKCKTLDCTLKSDCAKVDIPCDKVTVTEPKKVSMR